MDLLSKPQRWNAPRKRAKAKRTTRRKNPTVNATRPKRPAARKRAVRRKNPIAEAMGWEDPKLLKLRQSLTKDFKRLYALQDVAAFAADHLNIQLERASVKSNRVFIWSLYLRVWAFMDGLEQATSMGARADYTKDDFDYEFNPNKTADYFRKLVEVAGLRIQANRFEFCGVQYKITAKGFEYQSFSQTPGEWLPIPNEIDSRMR